MLCGALLIPATSLVAGPPQTGGATKANAKPADQLSEMRKAKMSKDLLPIPEWLPYNSKQSLKSKERALAEKYGECKRLVDTYNREVSGQEKREGSRAWNRHQELEPQIDKAKIEFREEVRKFNAEVELAVNAVTALVDVPGHLPDKPISILIDGQLTTVLSLRERWRQLFDERQKIQKLRDEHNAKQAPKDTPSEERLRLEEEQLREMMLRHLEASKAFNEAVASREKSFRENTTSEDYQKFLKEFQDKLHSSREGDREKPLYAPCINYEGERSAYQYFKVIEQFQVEHKDSDGKLDTDRYVRGPQLKPGKKPEDENATETWCNVYARDVMSAMGVHLPSFFNCDQMGKWLRSDGGRSSGWKLIGPEEAKAKASAGCPTIAIHPTHVMVVRPGLESKKESDANKEGRNMLPDPAITQAGASLMDARHIHDISLKQRDIEFWYHE